MRLGFDLRPFLKEETGVGVYLRHLLENLAKIDEKNEYYLFSSSYKDRFPREKLPAFRNFHFRDKKIPVRCLNFFWYGFTWPPVDTFFGTCLDLTHSATPFILPSRGKKVVTVHDLFALDYPQLAEGEARWAFRRRIKKNLVRADGIITFSEYMYRDIRRRFPFLPPEKIRVIPHGLDPLFLEPVCDAEVKAFARRKLLPSDFLLFVGTLEARKNVARLIQAFREISSLRPSLHLVLIGKRGREGEKIKGMVEDLGLKERVHFKGYVDRSELKLFYHLARALVIPSLVEGFGFPVIEAMACSLPVLASRTSALPEVGGEAALYFDPENVKEIIQAIQAILDNPDLRFTLCQKGLRRAREFSWEKAAARTLDFYEKIVGQKDEDSC